MKQFRKCCCNVKADDKNILRKLENQKIALEEAKQNIKATGNIHPNNVICLNDI